MSNKDDKEIGFKDTIESGQNLLQNIKEFVINIVLSVRNSVNRQHWIVRGAVKTAIGWTFIQVVLSGATFLLNIDFLGIAVSFYDFLVALFPSIQLTLSQVLISFIGLFIVFESIQLRRLSRIEELVDDRIGPQPDGGTREEEDDDSSSTAGSALGGAIAGAAIGSAFGPQGAALGALAGAVFGSELEKSQTRKRSSEIQCALLATLISHHAWQRTVPKEQVIRHAVPPENRRHASQVWENLGYEAFILATERGYRLDPNNLDQLAYFLRDRCGWSEQEIQARLRHYEPGY